MCDLCTELKMPAVRGYKVVATNLRDGKKYSLAMGCCYDDWIDGKVIPVYQQNRIGKYFHTGVLVTSHSELMVGRTAIFLDERAAYFLCDVAAEDTNADNYRIEVWLCELSDSLWAGFYGSEMVCAGRKIKFLHRVY